MNSEEYEEGVSDDEGEVLGEDTTTGEGGEGEEEEEDEEAENGR